MNMCVYHIFIGFGYSHQINAFSNKIYKPQLDLDWIRTMFFHIHIIHVFLYFKT